MSGRSVILVTQSLDKPPTVLSTLVNIFTTSLHAKFYMFFLNHGRRNATVMFDHRPALFRVAHATKLFLVTRVITVGFEFLIALSYTTEPQSSKFFDHSSDKICAEMIMMKIVCLFV